MVSKNKYEREVFTMNKKEVADNSSKYICVHCDGKLTEQKDLVLVGGKVFTKKVMICEECGRIYSDLFELQKLENLLKPSFFRKN